MCTSYDLFFIAVFSKPIQTWQVLILNLVGALLLVNQTEIPSATVMGSLRRTRVSFPAYCSRKICWRVR